MKEELTFANVCCGSGVLLSAFNLKALLPNHHPQCGDEKTWASCRMPGQNALPRFPSQPEPGPWGTCQQLEAFPPSATQQAASRRSRPGHALILPPPLQGRRRRATYSSLGPEALAWSRALTRHRQPGSFPPRHTPISKA